MFCSQRLSDRYKELDQDSECFFLLGSWPLAQLKTSDAGTDLVDVVQNDS